jgi:hypothetical protein
MLDLFDPVIQYWIASLVPLILPIRCASAIQVTLVKLVSVFSTEVAICVQIIKDLSDLLIPDHL